MPEAVCIGSGPSLTPEDVELVRKWKEESTDRKIYVANTTYRAALWADAVFGMDRKWWAVHYDEVCRTFTGRRLTTATIPKPMDITRVATQHYRNSGAGCVSVAASEGANRIILLGFDCSHDGQKTHWHGSHPAPLGDAITVKLWPPRFDILARDMRKMGVEVINSSRRTVLHCFVKMDLEVSLNADVLCA